MNTENLNSERVSVGSSDLVLPLRERIDALSADSKYWIAKSCERFADGQGYDLNLDAINECLAAKLITKTGRWIDIESDVMELVYSDGYISSSTAFDELSRQNA